METEQTKRSMLKTLTWRITASLDTFIIAWVITGDWKMGGSIAGIEGLTKEKAETLGRLGYEIGKNFDNFNLNFGMVPQTAGAGADMTISEGEQLPAVNVVNQAVQSSTNTNVRRQYSATGVQVNHSRAHSSLP